VITRQCYQMPALVAPWQTVAADFLTSATTNLWRMVAPRCFKARYEDSKGRIFGFLPSASDNTVTQFRKLT